MRRREDAPPCTIPCFTTNAPPEPPLNTRVPASRAYPSPQLIGLVLLFHSCIARIDRLLSTTLALWVSQSQPLHRHVQRKQLGASYSLSAKSVAGGVCRPHAGMCTRVGQQLTSAGGVCLCWRGRRHRGALWWGLGRGGGRGRTRLLGCMSTASGEAAYQRSSSHGRPNARQHIESPPCRAAS